MYSFLSLFIVKVTTQIKNCSVRLTRDKAIDAMGRNMTIQRKSLRIMKKQNQLPSKTKVRIRIDSNTTEN